MEWRPRPDNPFHARLYRDRHLYRLWIRDLGWFTIDAGRLSIEVPAAADEVTREVRLWGIPAALCIIECGNMALHAAAVEVDGRAILLAAPGRHGKTTLAGAFFRAGYRVLAEDMSCCQPTEKPRLFPGPALLRVRRDVYDVLEFPGTQPLAEEPGRLYLSLEPTLRGDGAPLPIGAIVFLRRSDEPVRLERVEASDAVRDLWALSLNLPGDDERVDAFRKVAYLANRVPMWNVHRRLEFEGLERVIDRIVSTCLSS